MNYWAALPGLCCQAAGGEESWAEPLTLAWLVFFAAARLMDKVQDRDEPDPWWRDLGSGAALNAASGLYFSASLLLNELYVRPETRPAAGEAAQGFYQGFLQMCSGQHGDLTWKNLSLEEYWRIAAAKSGAFFSLACRGAARLGTTNQDLLDRFERYGMELGILVQISDDLEDIKPVEGGLVPGQRPQLSHSLPVVYALEVFPEVEKKHLRNSLSKAVSDDTAAQAAIDLIDRSGAGLYMMAEIERHRALALNSLKGIPESPALQRLAAIPDDF